jgi:hypothetical protein
VTPRGIAVERLGLTGDPRTGFEARHLPGAVLVDFGISAVLLAFGPHLLGKEDVAVYDGSWTEWAGCGDTEIVIS